MKYEKQRIDSAALHRISCSCVGSLSSVALFCCIFSFGTFFGIIRVYTVVFSDPAQKVSRSTVVLGKCFAYDIYLEKINGEWYVSGFSDNTDFIDMYLGCFSDLAQNMNYISNLFTS